MSDQLPDPLVPAEVDLRDFQFMPLDVVRLRDSELSAVPDGEVFRAAVLSWCVAWHQVPAGSLPDDDAMLARLLGYGRDVRTWKKLRADGALRGWILANDGRLYHSVVAEKARDAWVSKMKQRWMTECARIKKHNQRHKIEINVPDFDEWMSLGCPQGQPLPVPGTASNCPQGQRLPVPRETHSKGSEGTAKGQGQLSEDQKQRCTEPPPESPTREGAVAVLLRAAGIGKAMSTHPDVIALAETGVSDEQLREAIEQAKVSLKGELPRAAGYLVPIVREILSPPVKAAKSSPVRRAQPEQDFSKLDYSKGF